MQMEAVGFVPPQMRETPAQQQLHDDYHHAICDCCDFPILGVRFKCLNCPDFDICASCEQDGQHAAHPATHLFLVLPRPVPQEHAAAWKQHFPAPLCVDEAGTGSVHRGAFCTQCKAPVVGARYVCVNCPSMFCLCEGCFSGRAPIDKHVNGRNHVMLKIPFAPSPSLPMEEESNSSGEYACGMHVDASLFQTPDGMTGALSPGRGVLVKSPLENDVRVPLLPVLYAGDAAVNPLSRSAERREQLAEAEAVQRKRRAIGDAAPVHIREMTIRDVDESVMPIETESFSQPFEREYFTNILERGHYFAWVAEVNGAVVGYIALRIRRGWTDIQSLAVSTKARGCGVGRQLMERALSLADVYETNVRLHVSVWNVGALSLYKSLGFVAAKWLFDYYQRDEEDAIEMYIERPKK